MGSDDLRERGASPATTLSGDADHIYVTDESGRILSTFDTLEEAQAAMRCACRGSRRLSRQVIDGTDGWITCPWCLAAPSSSEGLSDGE